MSMSARLPFCPRAGCDLRIGCQAMVLGVLLWVAPFGYAEAQSAESEGQDVDWPTVIAQLQQQLRDRPGHAQTLQQLAIAHNNYGVSLSEQKQWNPASEQFHEAIRLDDHNTRFLTNLSNVSLHRAQDAYQHHHDDEALHVIDEVLTVNPDLAPAYALRGEIEYGRQHLKEAQTAWQRAAELDSTQARLLKRLNQVQQELPVESKFERLSQAYFDLRYEEQLERPVEFDIRDALLEARRAVGADFAYWPGYRIVVLVYSAESFRALRQETPDWVGGQFDGKIRVPMPGRQLAPEAVKRIVSHEYTHAVIHDLTSEKCPTWLNEGLAEYEGRKQGDASLAQLGKAYAEGKLLPWTQLSDQFAFSLSAETVALGYEESYSVVRCLVDRYGFWRIRHLLKMIAEGQPWEQAFVREFHLKLDRLDANWREWLAEFLKSSS